MGYGMREQTFSRTDIIGYSTDSGSVVDTTLHNVMERLNLLPNDIEDSLIVGYQHEEDGIHIYEISNALTNEVYWEKNDVPGNRMWSSADESLVENLLMWGELE